MQLRTLAAALSMTVMLGAGSAMAWDLHDTLAPGPTPETADSPPITEDTSGGADLQIPDIDLPGVVLDDSNPVHSRCAEAIAQQGENSAEAWTQC